MHMHRSEEALLLDQTMPLPLPRLLLLEIAHKDHETLARIHTVLLGRGFEWACDFASGQGWYNTPSGMRAFNSSSCGATEGCRPEMPPMHNLSGRHGQMTAITKIVGDRLYGRRRRAQRTEGAVRVD